MAPVIPQRRLIHTTTIAIRWGDMDAMKHVNNAVYFRYMEQARVELYQRLGVNDGGPALPPNCGPVVINASCTFLRALTYPGDVELLVYAADPGRASVMTYYVMRPSYDPEVVYAEASAKACWIDTVKNKSIPLPAAIRSLFEAPEAAAR